MVGSRLAGAYYPEDPPIGMTGRLILALIGVGPARRKRSVFRALDKTVLRACACAARTFLADQGRGSDSMRYPAHRRPCRNGMEVRGTCWTCMAGCGTGWPGRSAAGAAVHAAAARDALGHDRRWRGVSPASVVDADPPDVDRRYHQDGRHDQQDDRGVPAACDVT